MQQDSQKKYDTLFKTKKHLGTGSFGRVVKSLSKIDGKTYAVKLLENVELIYLDSIRSEAEAMMRAKSDYTVELLDHFFDEQTCTYVFVMPYYSKGNLSQYLEKKWNKLDILSFLYQICQAFLSFSKQGACWHLDLKPDNILVKNEGEYLICDFGCAKLVDNINNSLFLQISMNRGGGTTSYAAPQVILDYEGGRFSDVWSLGVMLYRILYSKHPIELIDKKPYSEVVKMFRQGKYKIHYPLIPGYEQIINICKQILQPGKRLQWEQLKRIIYQCIGLQQKTEIVVNIQKFISYAQNVSKIVMGLVFYLSKNQKYVTKYNIQKEAQKIISSAKAYVSLLYREVENTIEHQNQDKTPSKNESKSYYIFPQTQKNYTIQEKQRLTHLRAVAQNFCRKEYEKNINQDFATVKKTFESDIKQFLAIFRMDNLDKLSLHPFAEWHKINEICTFIYESNQLKYPGLEYADRDLIQNFAYRIVYQ